MKQMQSNNKKPVVVGIGELVDMLPTGKESRRCSY